MAVSSIYDQTIAELLKAQQEKEAFYRKQQEEQAKKLQTQVDNAVQRLESGKQQYTDTYHQNAKSAYQQKQRALRDLPQRLAAQGISGGMSESANIALNNSYSSQLGGYKRDYDAALRSIDQSIGDVRSQYDASLADLNAQTLANIADSKSYYDEQILAQKNAKAQAEEAQRLAEEQRRAEEAARRQTAQRSSGGGTGSGNSLSSYLKRAQSLMDKQGNASAFSYLRNLAEQGYIGTEDVRSIAAEIGIPQSEIKRLLNAERIASQAANAVSTAASLASIAAGIAKKARK